MRTMSWILVSGLVAASIGCQRAEKVAAEKTPAAESPSSIEVAQEVAPVAEASESEVAAQIEPAPVAVPTTDAKTAAAEVEPVAQPTTAKAETASASQPAKAADASTAKGFPTKAEILASPQFRRAIFEFNEWLTSQPIYTPQQVAQIKDQFNHRVAEMNAEELTYLLNDLEAKMQLINTPEAREARAWMAQYLSVMSDRKRADVLKDVPNVATMTAAQLSSELSKIQEKRLVMDNEQAAFQKGQAAQVAQQVQTDRINQQNYVRDWNTGPVAYSPYSSNSNVNQRLNNTPIGTGMSFYTGGFGGVGIAFSPSAW
jgi:hypothetical protein